MSDSFWISHRENIPEESRLVLNEYLLSLKLANKAEATIRKYKRILEQFLRGCTISLESLTSEDVLTWLNEFSKDKKPRTIDLYHACLSSFFQFCLEEEFMENMVMKKRWRPKITQSLPKYLTEEDYAKVRLATEELSLRNRALILFLFSSGCRRGELCNLTIGDVNLEKRTANVVGKGNKRRAIHFSIECAIVLGEYLQTRGKYEDTDPLFMNKFGQALGPNGVLKITHQLGKKAGLNQSLHPHVCRHTFATNILARGADLPFIAEEMGHADLNTTRVYARIPTEEMINEYQNKMG
ncbi:tyrosine-type recombinase/integrase [Virgibacillus sediminis]|uniref:Tyrosine-type recombinase/integrase n=1 Tax=Virgibacillus sediminis TaxID=202260 RepID=A0ABV7A3Z2_9BACI